MVAGIGHRHPLFYGIFVIINITFLRFEASSVAWFYIIIIYIINYNKFNYYYYINIYIYIFSSIRIMIL